MRRLSTLLACLAVLLPVGCGRPIATPQTLQVEGVRDVVRWGPDPDRYASWNSHTNRLVPVYAFGTRGAGPGIDLDDYRGEKSVYRDAKRLTELYGRLPDETLNPAADYFDQRAKHGAGPAGSAQMNWANSTGSFSGTTSTI